MVTRYSVVDALNLLDTAQREGDIFGQTARGFAHWLEKYADNRTAWHHGVLHQLEDWIEENEEPTSHGLLRGPEMAPAIGAFVEGMPDLN